jgi:hypothetical protein
MAVEIVIVKFTIVQYRMYSYTAQRNSTGSIYAAVY